MIVIGTDIAEAYFKSRTGHRGIKAARAQYDAWLAFAGTANRKDAGRGEESAPEGEHIEERSCRFQY
ncbi:MAG: hypothetical protein WDM77_14090 [Steroidobacteraceae bacterium]